MDLLEYENQIFLDCFHQDGLLVLAKYVFNHILYHSFLVLTVKSDPDVLTLHIKYDKIKNAFESPKDVIKAKRLALNSTL